MYNINHQVLGGFALSLFGKKLQKVIESNQINVYRLTQQAGIERTMIHKIIANARIPEAEYVHKLIAALPVSPFEREELQAAYNISKDGEFLYLQRGQVKRLIEKMYSLQTYPPAETGASPAEVSSDKPETEIIRGGLSVNRLMDEILRQEAQESVPCVFFNLPHEYAFFFDNLYLRVCQNPALTVECMFEFSKNNDIVLEKHNVNLDIIDVLLPFIMRGGGFNATYVYSLYPAKYTSAIPMPYFVGTSNCVVTLESNMQSGIVIRNTEVTRHYRQIFDSLKDKGQPLLGYADSMEEAVAYYSQNADTDSAALSGFGSHPCIASYYDRETLDDLMPPELPDRDRLLDMTQAVYQSANRLLKKGSNISFFALDGFEVFVREGRIETISEGFMRAYSPSARAKTIRRMIADTEKDLMQYRIINTSNIKIPARFYADVFSGSCVNLVMGGSDTQSRINTVNIYEPGVVEAFHDFLTKMIGTDLVYSKADTLREFYSALETLKL
jgi:hypothetical protein